MAGVPIQVLIQFIGDAKSYASAGAIVDKVTKGVTEGVRQANQELVKFSKNTATTSATVAKSAGSYNVAQQSANRLLATQRQLASQNVLLANSWKQGSNIVDKRYLNSIGGLRQALSRFKKEAAETIVLNKGMVTTLDDTALGFERMMIKGNFVTRTLSNMANGFVNMGKNAQWTGRQMMVGITAPLALIGGYAVKSAIDISKADLAIKKLVQGGVTDLKKLDEQSVKLSEKFGTTRLDVKAMQQEFASVGFNQQQITNLTQITTEFQKLTRLNADEAFSMVRVLAQNEPSLGKVRDDLEKFNEIENKTALNMQDITSSFSEIFPLLRRFNTTAPETVAILTTFKQAGVDVSQGVGALKNVITKVFTALSLDNMGQKAGSSRLKFPLDAIKRLNSQFGLNISIIDQATNKQRTAIDVLLQLGQAYSTLNKLGGHAGTDMINFLTRAIGVGEQANNVSILFDSMGKSLDTNTAAGQDFAKAMKIAMDSSGEAAARWKSQIDQFLNDPSTEVQTSINKVVNSAQELGKKILPIVISALSGITSIIDKFNNLSDGTKKFIVALATGFALLGPAVYIAGQGMIAFGTIMKGVIAPAKIFFKLKGEMIGLGTAGSVTQELTDKFSALHDQFARTGDRTAMIKGTEAILNEMKAAEAVTDAATAADEVHAAQATRTAAALDAEAAAEMRLAAARGKGSAARLPTFMGANAAIARDIPLITPRTFEKGPADVAGLRERMISDIMGVNMGLDVFHTNTTNQKGLRQRLLGPMAAHKVDKELGGVPGDFGNVAEIARLKGMQDRIKKFEHTFGRAAPIVNAEEFDMFEEELKRMIGAAPATRRVPGRGGKGTIVPYGPEGMFKDIQSSPEMMDKIFADALYESRLKQAKAFASLSTGSSKAEIEAIAKSMTEDMDLVEPGAKDARQYFQREIAAGRTPRMPRRSNVRKKGNKEDTKGITLAMRDVMAARKAAEEGGVAMPITNEMLKEFADAAEAGPDVIERIKREGEMETKFMEAIQEPGSKEAQQVTDSIGRQGRGGSKQRKIEKDARKKARAASENMSKLLEGQTQQVDSIIETMDAAIGAGTVQGGAIRNFESIKSRLEVSKRRMKKNLDEVRGAVRAGLTPPQQAVDAYLAASRSIEEVKKELPELLAVHGIKHKVFKEKDLSALEGVDFTKLGEEGQDAGLMSQLTGATSRRQRMLLEGPDKGVGLGGDAPKVNISSERRRALNNLRESKVIGLKKIRENAFDNLEKLGIKTSGRAGLLTGADQRGMKKLIEDLRFAISPKGQQMGYAATGIFGKGLAQKVLDDRGIPTKYANALLDAVWGGKGMGSVRFKQKDEIRQVIDSEGNKRFATFKVDVLDKDGKRIVEAASGYAETLYKDLGDEFSEEHLAALNQLAADTASRVPGARPQDVERFHQRAVRGFDRADILAGRTPLDTGSESLTGGGRLRRNKDKGISALKRAEMIRAAEKQAVEADKEAEQAAKEVTQFSRKIKDVAKRREASAAARKRRRLPTDKFGRLLRGQKALKGVDLDYVHPSYQQALTLSHMLAGTVPELDNLELPTAPVVPAGMHMQWDRQNVVIPNSPSSDQRVRDAEARLKTAAAARRAQAEREYEAAIAKLKKGHQLPPYSSAHRAGPEIDEIDRNHKKQLETLEEKKTKAARKAEIARERAKTARSTSSALQTPERLLRDEGGKYLSANAPDELLDMAALEAASTRTAPGRGEKDKAGRFIKGMNVQHLQGNLSEGMAGAMHEITALQLTRLDEIESVIKRHVPQMNDEMRKQAARKVKEVSAYLGAHLDEAEILLGDGIRSEITRHAAAKGRLSSTASARREVPYDPQVLGGRPESSDVFGPIHSYDTDDTAVNEQSRKGTKQTKNAEQGFIDDEADLWAENQLAGVESGAKRRTKAIADLEQKIFTLENEEATARKSFFSRRANAIKKQRKQLAKELEGFREATTGFEVTSRRTGKTAFFRTWNDYINARRKEVTEFVDSQDLAALDEVERSALLKKLEDDEAKRIENDNNLRRAMQRRSAKATGSNVGQLNRRSRLRSLLLGTKRTGVSEFESQTLAEMHNQAELRGLPHDNFSRKQMEQFQQWKKMKQGGYAATGIFGKGLVSEDFTESIKAPRQSFVSKTKSVLGKGANMAVTDTKKVAGTLLDKATWLNPLTPMTRFATGLEKVGSGFGKMAGNMVRQSPMLTSIFPNMAEGLATTLEASGPLLPVLVILAALLAALALTAGKWWKFASDGFEKLKEGGTKLISAVFNPIKGLFIRIFGDGKKGTDGLSESWKNLGKGIGKIFEIIGAVFEKIAPIANFIVENIASTIFVIVQLFRMVIALVTGDWSSFGDALKNIWNEIWTDIKRTIAGAGTAIVEIIADIMVATVRAIGIVTGLLRAGIDALPIGTPLDAPIHKLDDMVNTLGDKIIAGKREIQDKMSGWLEGNNTKAGKEAKDSGKKTGEDIGDGVQEGLDNSGPLEAPAVDDSSAADAAKNFISAFQTQLRKVVDGWKEAALAAFDATAKAQEKAIDDQIAALEAETKAEEQHQQDLDYLQRKEEARNKRRSENISYSRDRDLAIYEGRYDDAAMLALQHQETLSQMDKDEIDIEKDRQKVLTDRVREGEKERLNIQKENIQTWNEALRKGLQEQLDAITEYIPKNVDEARNMQQQIQDVMNSFTQGYGTIGTDQAANWGRGWSDAFAAAQKQVAEDAFWAGDGAMKSFASGLGIDPNTINNPMPDLGTLTHDVGSQGTQGPGTRTTQTDGGQSQAGKFHTGGPIGNTSMAPADIPATLQTGEYVIQRDAVAKYGIKYLDALNSGNKYHSGGLVDYAHNGMTNTLVKGIGQFLGGAPMGNLSWAAIQDLYRQAIGQSVVPAIGATLKAGLFPVLPAPPTVQDIVGTFTGGSGDLKAMVQSAMASFGWGQDQWNSLDQLIGHESGWNPGATNPSSGAWGLFQFMPMHFKPGGALPHGMSSTISEQIQAGLSYIQGRYGNPGSAWSFWQRTDPRPYPGHWYHQGGLVFPQIPSLDTGGFILSDGIAKVHKGEQVKNAAAVARGDGVVLDLDLHFEGGYFGTDNELKKLVDEIEKKIAPKIARMYGTQSRTISGRTR